MVASVLSALTVLQRGDIFIKLVKESCYLVNPAQIWQETDGDYCTLMVMSSAGDSSCKLFAS